MTKEKHWKQIVSKFHSKVLLGNCTEKFCTIAVVLLTIETCQCMLLTGNSQAVESEADGEVFQLVEEEESDQIRHLCSIVGAQGDVELFPRTPLLTVVL